jgi:hypothetical protein
MEFAKAGIVLEPLDQLAFASALRRLDLKKKRLAGR